MAPWQAALLKSARRATLATIAPDGRPRLVPACFALPSDPTTERITLYVPLDEKPKRSADPGALARVRDIARDPRVTVLVDHWSEDWSELAWLRLEGTASLVEPRAAGHAVGVSALRRRYPQYRDHALESRPLIRIDVERMVAWSAGTSRG